MVDGLEVSLDEGVVQAVVDRAPGNEFTTPMCHALADLLEGPPANAHILRLTARGPAFCLGRERAASTAEGLEREVDALIRLNTALRTSRLVPVAAVHGDAAGFGVGLAALCEVVVAAPGARFWFPEVELDLAPTVVLSWLPNVVGRRAAFRLTATGERIGAAEARSLGLVSRVAPSVDELDPCVDEVVAALVEFSPDVHARIRRFLDSASTLDERRAHELARDSLVLAGMRRHRHP